MAEFVYNDRQIVNANQPVVLRTSIPCNKGYVFHRNESGIITLRGIVNNVNACFARYQVTFNGNIAIPEGGTAPAAISVALALDGEPILTSKAIATPAAAAEAVPSNVNFFNVTSTAIITVPKGCCFNVSVENTSESATPATVPAPAIEVQNANLTVTRIA
jgi:hypothetical protein